MLGFRKENERIHLMTDFTEPEREECSINSPTEKLTCCNVCRESPRLFYAEHVIGVRCSSGAECAVVRILLRKKLAARTPSHAVNEIDIEGACVPLIGSGSFKRSNGCPSVSIGRMFSNRFSQKSCRGFVLSLDLPAAVLFVALCPLALIAFDFTSSRFVG